MTLRFQTENILHVWYLSNAFRIRRIFKGFE